MGVGVYSSDFNGSGGTLIINGPLDGSEDYQAYLRERRDEISDRVSFDRGDDGSWRYRISDANGGGQPSHPLGPYGSLEDCMEAACGAIDEHFVGEATFLQEHYNDFNARFIEVIETLGKEIGMDVAPRRHFAADSAAFDNEFTAILSTAMLGVGWRSWEHDFVIGVGASDGDWQNYLGDPFSYREELFNETGCAPTVFAEKVANLKDQLLSVLQITLHQNGFECSYKTSGYTSRPYAAPSSEALAGLSALKEQIKVSMLSLRADPEEAIRTQTPDERLAFIKEYYDWRETASSSATEQFVLAVPVYREAKDSIIWIDACSSEVFAEAGTDIGDCPVVLSEALRDLPQKDGLKAIPRTGPLADWYDRQQIKRLQRHNKRIPVVVTAEEVVQALGKDFTIEFDEFYCRVDDVLRLGQVLLDGGEPLQETQDRLRSQCAELLGSDALADEKLYPPELGDGLKAILDILDEPDSSDTRKANECRIKRAFDVVLPETGDRYLISIPIENPTSRPRMRP